MSTDTIYKSKYGQSWALVIGINKYEKTSQLEFAVNDAKAIAQLFIDKFHFPKNNVSLLVDKEASRELIFSKFLNYSKECEPDDRILVFFAGHGHTITGKRGDVGYLVPVDGSPDELSSLIRWDDLTRNAELIPAKHIFFVMDACYGGLALTRSIAPGSMRFLKDMVQRYSRQLLTSGKGNELVADGGGPIAGHSIFTGHFLNALEGKAATGEGILTANIVMSYVYDRVATDYHSRQTPHYGFVDGDGDFIFDLSPLEGKLEESEIDKDVLIELPPTINVPSTATEQPSIENVKEYLSDNRCRIKLDDLVNSEIRKAIYKVDDSVFPVQTSDVSVEELVERLKKYEQITTDLQKILILLAKWGTHEHKSIMEKILARFGEANAMVAGKVVWIGLRWYPIHLLLYSGGIAALAAENYENLATILKTKIVKDHGGASVEIILESVDGISDVLNSNIFKKLPGHERNYVPLSEYMLKVLQPPFEDLLFLGRQYEALFDKFEVFYALIYADLNYDNSTGHVWGPLGRFAWKYNSRARDTNPFSEILTEAFRMKEQWPPLLNGFFQGSYERFRLIAESYEKKLKNLNWW